MTRLKTVLASAGITVLVIILASCAQMDSTGTMKILLHSDLTEKTINISDTVLDITKYTVSGSGPGGKTFAVDTTSSSLTLSGMPLGSWTVQATGLNSRGKQIASGSTSFVLDSQGSPHSISLSTLKGTGSIQIKYEWDSDITQPEIAVRIYTEQSDLISRTITPTEGSTSCTVTFNDIASGSYILTSRLLNNGRSITGSTEAVRIANSEKTTGTISFRSSDSYSSDLKTLYVYRPGQSALTGHFSGTADTLETGADKKVELILDTSYRESEGFMLTWYLDGIASSTQQLSSYSNSFTVTPSIGCHIVNAVVSDPSTGNLGSASWKFNADTSGKEGLAMYIGCVESSSYPGLFLRRDTILLPLPDERFYIVTPSCGTSRLCSIYNTDFTIHERHSASDEGWSFLPDITSGSSSPSMNNIVLVSSERDIRILEYSLSKGCVIQANHGENPAIYKGKYENLNLTFSGINLSMASPSNDQAGNIWLSDRSSKSLYVFTTNQTSVIAVGTIQKPDGVVQISGFDTLKTRFACFSGEDGKFSTCTINGSYRTSFWDSTDTGFSKLRFLRLLNTENLITSDGNEIIPFTLSGKTLWIPREHIKTTVKAVQTAPDGRFFWVVDESDRLITYTTADNMIYSIGHVQLPKNIVSATLNGSFLILMADDASLLICRISQGE